MKRKILLFLALGGSIIFALGYFYYGIYGFNFPNSEENSYTNGGYGGDPRFDGW